MLAQRDIRNVEERHRIALAAIEELPVEDTVLLDSGSTTARVYSRMPLGRSPTVFTNSILNVQLLTENEDVAVVVLGGAFDKKALSTLDEHTVVEIQQLKSTRLS